MQSIPAGGAPLCARRARNLRRLYLEYRTGHPDRRGNMETMRVLYHHRTQGRDVEAIHIHGFCAGMRQLGYDVEIVGPPGVQTNPNAVAASAGKRRTLWGWVARHAPQLLFEFLEIGYNAVAVARLWRRCRASSPALIYERYALYNAAAVLVGRLARTPVVLEVNETAGVDRLRHGKTLVMPGLARRFERLILRRASGIVVVSGYLRDQILALGIPSERVVVTPNAVDVGRFDPEKADSASIRARYGLEGKTIIGFAGSFARWHRVDLLLRACGRLMPEHKDIAILLVGDGARRSEAEALAQDLGIADRVVFTGKIAHSDIPAYIGAMDIGVMPESNLFGSPMKVFEYMAMGRPPVAPAYGPLQEAICEGQDGLLFQPGDEAGLARCLRDLVADPERRRALGAAARRKVLSCHQWVHNAQAVLELIAQEPPMKRPRLADDAVRSGQAQSGRRI